MTARFIQSMELLSIYSTVVIDGTGKQHSHSGIIKYGNTKVVIKGIGRIDS